MDVSIFNDTLSGIYQLNTSILLEEKTTMENLSAMKAKQQTEDIQGVIRFFYIL